MKTITTPKGKALYPKVNEPDTKFDALGKYSCDIIVSAEDGEAFRAKLEELYDEQYEAALADLNKGGKKKKLRKAATFPVEIHDEEDGTYIIKCRRPAKVVSKSTGQTYEFSVKLFDGKGQPCSPNVGSGSLVKCAIEPHFWNSSALGFGLSLRLQAVQVIELVEFSGGEKAESYGFASEDGSFVSDSEDFGDALDEDETDGDF